MVTPPRNRFHIDRTKTRLMEEKARNRTLSKQKREIEKTLREMERLNDSDDQTLVSDSELSPVGESRDSSLTCHSIDDSAPEWNPRMQKAPYPPDVAPEEEPNDFEFNAHIRTADEANNETQASGLDASQGESYPNKVLVETLKGKKADWPLIQTMAKRIFEEDYSLKQFFDDCVRAFPELALFFVPHATLTSGRPGAEEYQRTIGALFSVYWFLRLDIDGKMGFCYGADLGWAKPEVAEALVPVPKKGFFQMSPGEKRRGFLQTMDWNLLSKLVSASGCIAENEGRVCGLLALTAFHDIMKVEKLLPTVLPEHAPYFGHSAGTLIHDHDVALAYVLEHYPDVLPSYAGLPEEDKKSLLFTQSKMNFNHGWFVQAEAPPGSLASFKQVMTSGGDAITKADISLYFLHWITDLAGAEACPLAGGEKLVLKFPHHVLHAFLWSIPFLELLSAEPETVVMEKYLLARWQEMGDGVPPSSNAYAVALLRLAVMAQASSVQMVQDSFELLSQEKQNILADELALTACAGQQYSFPTKLHGPAFLIYYGPALLQLNNSDSMLLIAALTTLSHIFQTARELFPASDEHVGQMVKVEIGPLKRTTIDVLLDEREQPWGMVWAMVRHSNQEAQVKLASPSNINTWIASETQYRILDLDNYNRCFAQF